MTERGGACMRLAAVCWLFATAAALAGCAPKAPVPELDLTAPLPAVAAQFRTRITADHGERRTEWRFWRDESEVTSEDLAERIGERWQLDGRTLFRTQLFHDDRSGVAMRADEFGVLDASPAWARQRVLVDPSLLITLENTQAGWRDGAPIRRYRGSVDGVAWDVTMRVDLKLPLVVERVAQGIRHRTELVAVHALGQAPWQPTSSTGYEIIDYADLGDRATDPFVIKAQSRLGLEFGHSH